MTETPVARWDVWRSVGCGVESLHHLLDAAEAQGGSPLAIDDVLAEALARDGYDEELGWRHRALVEVAAAHGVSGSIEASLTVEDLVEPWWWMVSVRAPEQFECTHLIAVRPDAVGLQVFWPQVHPEFGERFSADPAWLAPKMTGRGMRFHPRTRVTPDGARGAE